MSSIYGNNLKLSIFGQSHGPSIGMTLDGIPAGLPVNPDALQLFLNRRAPGQNFWSTPRKEEDRPEFLSGILDGYTCGAPIAAVIPNRNTRSGDYTALQDCPRPGHADFTANIKYGGFQDVAGGGHFSGRLTAPVCIAGGLCKQWLEEIGIRIAAHIFQIGNCHSRRFNSMAPELDQIRTDFPTLSEKDSIAMQQAILEALNRHDSIGGRIECAITGLPAGLGEPMFGGIESHIAQIVYGIPAVKAIGFGWSEAFAAASGTESNDPFTIQDGFVQPASNHCGGILGGITTGLPVIFDVTIKPTPSISSPQRSVSLSRMEEQTLEIKGRHDPCIVPRAVPVVEAAAAIALYDLILGNTQTSRRK